MSRLSGAAAVAVALTVGLAASAGARENPGLAARRARLGAAPGAGAGQPRSVLPINGDRLLAGTVPSGGIAHLLVAGTARGRAGH